MKLNITILLLLFLSNSFGQKAEKLDEFFTSLNKEGKFIGNVLIAEKGKPIYQKSFGLANEQTKEALNANSVFELASVSKQFTAMAIVILKEKGKLSYDDKLGKYIPELSFYKDITLLDLLQHTSGLPDYMELLDSLDPGLYKNNKIAVNRDIIEIFSKHKPKLLFEPGKKWEYSNTGYALLAVIIEKASGKKYADFLKAVIFNPLKMDNTFVYTRRLQPKKIKNYAFGYVYSDSLKKYLLPDHIPELHKMVYSLDGIVGDGTVNSTVNDLLKWDRALYTNNLVSKKSIDDIFTSGKLKDNSDTDYGFGWGIRNSKTYGKIVSHSGGWPGYITFIERHVDNDKTIIYLLNHANDNTTLPQREVRDILYDIAPLQFITLEPEKLQKYAGKYSSSDGTERNILFEDDKLQIPMGDDGFKLELKPLSQNKFYVQGFEPDVFYEFIIENDKVVKYINSQPEFGTINEAVRSN